MSKRSQSNNRAVQTQNDKSSSPKGGLQWWQWGLIGVAGVVAIGIVGKLMGKGSKSRSDKEDLVDKISESKSGISNNFFGDDDDEFGEENDDEFGDQGDENSAEWEMLITRAESLKHKGKFAESDSCFEKAYEIMKSSFDKDHSFIALLFASWAPVLTFLKKFPKAEEILKKSLQILSKEEEVPIEQLVEIYANLGEICIKTKKYDEAKNYLQLSIDKAEDKDNNPNVGVSKMNMAEVMFQEKKYAEVIQFCKEAIDIFKQHLEPSHPVILQTQLKIVSVYIEQGDINAADERFEQIISSQSNDQDGPTVALFMQQRANANYEFELYDKAKRLYQDCIQMIGNNYNLSSHFKNEYSCLLRTIGDIEGAEKLLLEVRKESEKSPTSPLSISKYFQVLNPQQFTVTYTEKTDNKKPWPVWASYKILLQIKRHPKDKTPRLKAGNIITVTLSNFDDIDEKIVDEHADTTLSRIVLTENMINGEQPEDRRAKLVIDAVKPAEGAYLAVVKVFENEEDEKNDKPLDFGIMKQISISRINTQDISVQQLKDIQLKQSKLAQSQQSFDN
eukprot:TRINITY_DN820_c0_g1_i1.p1 TRINITY_DN820_c0_g1~~TRINITY_DN820_c0_g1_i1.p1  ORF type:complete len:562 (-),score=208.18 TRINITY_DN820_c0_g1_i1:56-1741(-)